MTEITVITDRDLEGFTLDFGQNKRNFYDEFFKGLSNKEASDACGYIIRPRGSGTQALQMKATGRLRASRFKIACSKLNKDPKEISNKSLRSDEDIS